MRNYFVAAAIIVTAGCWRGGNTPQVEPISVFAIDERLLRGNETGLVDRLEQVVTTPEALRTIWQQALSTQRTPAPVPNVDFTRDMVIVVAAGRMQEDDAVRVDSVMEREVAGATRTERVLQVYYSLLEGCRRAGSQAAYPAEIVRVRRSPREVRFMPPQRTQNCR
jgi:hypothetical protein